jgi:hypothetical protein
MDHTLQAYITVTHMRKKRSHATDHQHDFGFQWSMLQNYEERWLPSNHEHSCARSGHAKVDRFRGPDLSFGGSGWPWN